MIRLRTLILCPILVSAALPLHATGAVFRNATIRESVREIQSGDVNGDGHRDLIVVRDNNDVVVRLGNGDGTFSTPHVTSPSAGTFVRSLRVADLNGDGRADAVMFDDLGHLLSYLGNTDGTFTPAGSVAGFLGNALVVADVNGDGHLDAAGAGSGGNYFAVALGTGSGTFAPPIPTPLYSSLNGLAAGDFNGDGKLDFILVGFTTQILTGTGDGSFTMASGPNGDKVAAADFNGDGRTDAVIGGRVFLAGPNGTLTQTRTIIMGDLQTADLDGNGHSGIVVSTGNQVTLFHGNGDGTFRQAHGIAATNTPVPAVADFDHDGRADVVMADTLGLRFLHANGDGTLRDAAVVTPLVDDGSGGVAGPGLATADFNADGKPDVVTVFRGQVVVLTNTNGGTFSPPASLPLPNGRTSVLSVAAGDVNNDGYPDIVVFGDGPSDAAVWSYLGHQDGSFTLGSVSESVVKSSTAVVRLGDINGDGRLDAVLSHGYRLFGQGDGTFPGPVQLPATADFLGDFNGDGRTDFIASSLSPATLYFSNADGTFTPLSINPNGVLATGDLNGDGRTDIIEGVNGISLSVRLGMADGTLRALPDFAYTYSVFSTPPTAFADFDGDGHADLAIGTDVLLGDGDGAFRGLAVNRFAVGQRYVTADVDGNGSPDILTVDAVGIVATLTRTAGAGAIALNNATTFTPESLHLNQSFSATSTLTTASPFVPSGGIILTVDGVPIAVTPLSFFAGNVQAFASSRSLSLGAHSITLTYTGDDVFSPMTTDLSRSVDRGLSSVYIWFRKEPSQVNEVTTADFGVADPSNAFSTIARTGTMTVRQNGALIVSTSAGQTSLVRNFQAPGTYTFTVDYSGDANYLPATISVDHLVIRPKALTNLASSATSILSGESLTLTATVNATVTPSGGTVSFFDRGVKIGSAALAGGKAALTIQPASGERLFQAQYDGDANVDAGNISSTLVIPVYAGAWGTPVTIRAVANSSVQVTVYGTPLTGATSYAFYARTTLDSAPVLLSSGSAATFTHFNATPNTTYLYTMVARRSAESSAPSALDWATTTPFTDDALVPGVTTIKAAHVTELRTAVNAMRVAAGLSSATWTNASLAGALVRASDVAELRAALAPALSALGASITFTDPTLSAGTTLIRAAHLQELRDAVK